MLRGASLHQPKFLSAKWHIVSLIIIGLSACNVMTPSLISATATPLSECQPLSYNMNIYNPTPVPTLPLNALPPTASITTPNAQQPNLTTKQSAFLKLEREVERWTDTRTIELGDASRARITITFLSPELLRAVSIIDIMTNHPNLSPDAEAERLLAKNADRKNLIFFLTVLPIDSTAETSNAHTIYVDINQLKLINAKGLSIAPASFDHDLSQTITLPQDVYGFLYYPLAVMSNGVCTEVLDSTFNTKIVLQTPHIILDKVESEPYSWTIKYTYLLDTGNSPITNDNRYVPADADIFSTNIPPTNPEISDTFWEQYAKFLWGQLTPAYP